MTKSDCTVIIHTHNEENNITDCITSAKLLTDNIVVIDMESSDDTVSEAKKYGAQVFNFPFSYYVEPARTFGIEKAESEWVMILDADERLTLELVEEIKSVVMLNSFQHLLNDKGIPKQVRDDIITNYKISRKNIFGKTKWLQHGGWFPDYQIRLINRKYFKEWPKQIHSTPLIDGQNGYLNNYILHYFHGDLEKMVEKTAKFENIESELLFKADKPVNTLTFFRKFIGEITRRLLNKLGFLDGPVGIIESVYQAFSKTITYLYLYEKKNRRTL